MIHFSHIKAEYSTAKFIMQYKKLTVGSKRKTTQKQAQQIWDEITASQINSEINCINTREQMLCWMLRLCANISSACPS